MEDKINIGDKIDSDSEGRGSGLFGILLLGLAGYGLYKLLTKETEVRKTIADRSESDFIEEIIRRELL